MADSSSSDFLLPATAYIPPPKPTEFNVVACTSTRAALVPTELLDPDSLEGRLAQAVVNGRKYRGRNRVTTLLRYIKPSLLPILKDKGTMINAKNLCDLLTENVGDKVTDWIVFTAYGTLIGYSDNTSLKKARKLAALVGAEWRIRHTAVTNGSNAVHNGPFFLTQVESFAYEQAGDGLRCMHGEAKGMMIAVHHVKGCLLVAAMIPLEEPDITERMESMQIFEAEEAEPAGANGEATSNDGRPLKRAILMLKAEGMVDVLIEDLSDFTVPEKFY